MGVPAEDAPLAIGGAPTSDPHIIPSQMVAATFAEAGWRTMNMGPSTPAHAIMDACEMHQPDLVWLAVKSKLGARELDEVVELCNDLAGDGIEVVVGGREVERTPGAWPETVNLVLTMTDLLSMARHLIEARTVSSN